MGFKAGAPPLPMETKAEADDPCEGWDWLGTSGAHVVPPDPWELPTDEDLRCDHAGSTSGEGKKGERKSGQHDLDELNWM